MECLTRAHTPLGCASGQVDDGLVDNIFGLCINGTYGTLMLGEIDEDALAGPVMFTPIGAFSWVVWRLLGADLTRYCRQW